MPHQVALTRPKAGKKLHNRIPSHEQSNVHKICYTSWRGLQLRSERHKGVHQQLDDSVEKEKDKWIQILKRILDVVLFCGQRGLAFRRESLKIGDPKNGNFLGIIEVLSHWDPILNDHVTKVKKSQEKKERLQVGIHYLSPETQNEFI